MSGSGPGVQHQGMQHFRDTEASEAAETEESIARGRIGEREQWDSQRGLERRSVMLRGQGQGCQVVFMGSRIARMMGEELIVYG